MIKIPDKRRSRRRLIRYRAQIATLDGSLTVPCLITDISQTGAQLQIEGNDVFPADFVLRLSAAEEPHRSCHLVWQGGNRAGVRFEKAGSETQPERQEIHSLAS